MNFGEAVYALKQGKKVARNGWNGKGMWLSLVKTGHYDVGQKTVGDIAELLPWIGMKTADNKFVPWLASQTDVLAEDWVVLQMVKRVGSLSAALSKYKDMNASVRVGVLENATYPDGTPVAMVAFWNEYGTKRSPVRAFFRTTVSEQKKNWVLSVQNLMKMHNDPKQVMGLIGEHMKGNIAQSIATWSDPPNAPYTVAQKGFDAPLRDTMQMLRSISFEVGEGD